MRTMFQKVVQRASIIIVSLLISVAAKAQKELSLEQSIRIALENNIDIKLARNNALIAAHNLRQSKFEFAPSVNAFVNFDWINGLTIDQTTGEPVTETTRRSSPQISANVDIFDGMGRFHDVSRNRLLEEAAAFDVENTEDNTSILVTGFYLQLLTTQANIEISKARIKLLNEQLVRARKRFEIGVDNQEQVFNLKSQIASENLNLVNLRNDMENSKLNLIQLIQLDPSEGFTFEKVEIPDEGIEMELESYGDIYEAALAYSPLLKSANLGLQVSQKEMEIAKAQRYPTLSAIASYGSFFSSVNESVDYFDQIDRNKQSLFGLRLNVPIFNQQQISNNIQVSKIQIVNSELNLEQARLDLTNNIQQAYQNLVAARSTWVAAKENMVALQQSFKYAQTSYSSGNIDFYTYLESLNNLNRAEIELVNAKYSFVLRRKIIDIYKGIDQ